MEQPSFDEGAGRLIVLEALVRDLYVEKYLQLEHPHQRAEEKLQAYDIGQRPANDRSMTADDLYLSVLMQQFWEGVISELRRRDDIRGSRPK